MYRLKNQRGKEFKYLIGAVLIGAILEMKKSKMLQKELNKLEGMQLLMMQQKMGLEGT